MRSRTPIVTVACLVLVSSAVAVRAESEPDLQLEACQVTLQGPGLAARFADTAVYELASDGDGAVLTITAVRPARLGEFVTLASFEQCLMRWRLRPDGTYTVTFRFGTADELLDRWLIDLVQDDGAIIRLTLPRGRGEGVSANERMHQSGH
jgi:hypothetical protein